MEYCYASSNGKFLAWIVPIEGRRWLCWHSDDIVRARVLHFEWLRITLNCHSSWGRQLAEPADGVTTVDRNSFELVNCCLTEQLIKVMLDRLQFLCSQLKSEGVFCGRSKN